MYILYIHYFFLSDMVRPDTIKTDDTSNQAYYPGHCLHTFVSKSYKRHKKYREHKHSSGKSRSGFGDRFCKHSKADDNSFSPKTQSEADHQLSEATGDWKEPDEIYNSWNYKDDYHSNEIQPLSNSVPYCQEYVPYSLSQPDCSVSCTTSHVENEYTNDRTLIEAEIRRKCNEIIKLKDQIRAGRLQRKNYQLRKYDIDLKGGSACDNPYYINVYPIKRKKRSAQPIRNALLIRLAMLKMCKGMLGSCCGRGCWASWDWVDLKKVMSDYH